MNHSRRNPDSIGGFGKNWFSKTEQATCDKSEYGGGLLVVVAMLGAIMLMVQGSLFYRAKGSAKFVGTEKNKILAQQMAEAGVEDNIAEFGTRNLKITGTVTDLVTFDHKALGDGYYSSTLSTVALGATADTVDLTSVGVMGMNSQKVQARLRLGKYLDTTRTPVLVVKPETTYTYFTVSVPESTFTTTVLDPLSMPDVNTTPAYTACMSSAGKKCDICHLPGGDLTKANVINVAKAAIGTHISHHGDYVTTDGTCDLYAPKTVVTVTIKSKADSTMAITDLTTYDTTLVIDTVVKTQFLSWK